jgi:hypothetical protein
MEAYRLALLRKQFPFIDRLFVDDDGQTDVWPEDCDTIAVKRGDGNLMTQTGHENSYSWAWGGFKNYTKYFAVTGEEVVELDSSESSATGSGESHNWNAPTVGEQLFQRGIVPDWIVECSFVDTDANGNGEVKQHWVIYKMTRFDLAEHHARQTDAAAAALKAEIAAACS